MATMALFLAILSTPNASASIVERRLQLIQDYVDEAAAHERIDRALILAIIRVESNFNHRAVSKAGARGLMQLMPPTAEQLGFRRALSKHNPRANVLAGTRYLREMLNEFRGNLQLAVAAYNAGPKAVHRFGGIPPFAETRDYVVKVMREFKRERREILKTSSGAS